MRNVISPIVRFVDRFTALEKVSAHCDIPCGIYDPHAAQIAALTTTNLNALTTTETQSLTPNQVKALTTTQLTGLTTDELLRADKK